MLHTGSVIVGAETCPLQIKLPALRTLVNFSTPALFSFIGAKIVGLTAPGPLVPGAGVTAMFA